MAVSEQNPVGLDGVVFAEYSGPEASYFDKLFAKLGMQKTASLHGKNIHLYQQGNIYFILNCEPQTFSYQFGRQHGPCISSMGLRVQNSEQAHKTAVTRGAKSYEGNDFEKGACPFPAVYGIGGSLIYFLDAADEAKLKQGVFGLSAQATAPAGLGMTEIDHFTNNVPRGEMDQWCKFYKDVFQFRETRYFHIKGNSTGLESRVMRSPCGKFSIPINEPTEAKSQIQEYLDEYKGSGVQHLALLTQDIVATLESMRGANLEFLSAPPLSYYAMLKDRLSNVTEDIERLEKNSILVDGDEQGYLLQIFTKNVVGPIFYEIIERKNHFGFGEGNFQALFDAIERDQKERGYL
jgi:4-hydroxyphenylpyruvate dioxygenase